MSQASYSELIDVSPEETQSHIKTHRASMKEWEFFTSIIIELKEGSYDIEEEKTLVRNLQAFGADFTEDEIDIDGKAQWLMKKLKNIRSCKEIL